jgi:hypothetical protein
VWGFDLEPFLADRGVVLEASELPSNTMHPCLTTYRCQLIRSAMVDFSSTSKMATPRSAIRDFGGARW